MAPSSSLSQELVGTNRGTPRVDLSLVEEYYRGAVEVQGFAGDYRQAVDAVRDDLLGLAGQGVNAGYLLHVLVCTRFHRFTPNWQAIPKLASLSPKQRGELLGATRALRKLGEKWRLFPFNPPTYRTGQEREYELQQREWERWQALYFGLVSLETSLAQGSYRTPAFQFGGGSRPGRRRQELIRQAGVVELMREVKLVGAKPAVVFMLLDKFDLFPPGLRRAAGSDGRTEKGLEWIKKVHQRNRTKAEDWRTPLGGLVMMFRQSFEGLLPERFEPAPDALIRRRAKSWGTSERKYRERFERYCQSSGLNPDREGLKAFEWALKCGMRALVPRPKRSQVFRSRIFLPDGKFFRFSFPRSPAVGRTTP